MDTLKLYVSGTASDMLLERDAVLQVVDSLRSIRMQLAVVCSPEPSSHERALQNVRECSVYIGLYNRIHYGQIDVTENASFPEIEFDEARTLGRPIAIFVKNKSELEREHPRQRDFINRVLAASSGKYNVFEFGAIWQLEEQLGGALADILSYRFHLRLRRPPFQAPRRLPTFVGRGEQIETITQLLSQEAKPKIHIHGLSDVGGIGKTELATEVAHRMRDTFPDGMLWAEVATTRPADTLATWARSFGGFASLGRGDLRFVFKPLPEDTIRMNELNARVDALYDLLRGKRVLGILDGVMDERDNLKIAPLVSALRDCAVIVTSRGAHVTAFKPATLVGVGRLTEREAIRLFSAVADSDRTKGHEALIGEIARVVDLAPLAIRLIASFFREHPQWTLEKLFRFMWDERSELETTRWSYEAARGMRAALNASYQHLSETERHFFAMLGGFSGDDFDAAAAESVTRSTMQTTCATLNRLERLSLVSQRRRLGRYTLHPLLKSYAREKPTENDAEGRAANYYCLLAQENGRKLSSPESRTAMVALDTEISNIFAGQKWAAARNDEMGWKLSRDFVSGAMTYYFSLKAMWSDWIAWSNRGIEACQALGDDKNVGAIAGGLGMVYYRNRDLDHALEFYKHGLAQMEKIGHLQGLATIYMNLGNLQTEKGQWKDALLSHSKSLAIRERLGDMRGQAQTRANMGILYARHGDRDKARANWMQSLEMFEFVGADHEADIVRNWLKKLPLK